MGSDKVLHLLFLYSDIYLRHIGSKRLNFNPRSPHGERPCDLELFTCDFHISIHAPRMGSDVRPDLRNSSPSLFQSTLPAWGATHPACSLVTWQKFQSTLPHGERQLQVFLLLASFCISIHAPAWGATVYMIRAWTRTVYFNPRSRMGSDGFFT